MQNSDYGIESYYMVSKNYKAVAEQSKRRNTLYDNYLEIMEHVFKNFKEFNDETHQLYRNKSHEKSRYVEEFKSFLRNFSEIIRDTSVYQIDCITQNRINYEDNISPITMDIVQKVQTFAKPQLAYKQKCDQIIILREHVEKQYSILKSESSQAIGFYNVKQMKSKLKNITDELSNISSLNNNLTQLKKQIHNNSQEFQSYIITFRKRLLQNKYHLLNRMNEQSKNFRNSLTEILLLLFECVNSKQLQFHAMMKNPKQDAITMVQSKGRKRVDDVDYIVSNLISAIQQYNLLIDEIIGILKGLDQGFKRVHTKVHEYLESSKKVFLENLNSLYSLDETPSREVTETLDLFQYYSNRLSGVSDKLYQSSNKLNMLKQNVKRHADVTLSLIRSAPKGKQQNRATQVEQVYQQISYEFVTEIIADVYKTFKDTLGDLKTHFNQKYYKKKKARMQDSMEISHIDQTMIAPKKKPCKKQLWLWRDWRDKTNYGNITPPTQIAKDVDKIISSFKLEVQSKQISKHECIFYAKKDVKGILKICENNLEFISLVGTSNVHIIIPYSQIQSAEVKSRMIDRYIAVKTEKGQLGFAKLSDISSIQKTITEFIQKANQGGSAKIVKKATVQLSQQQLDFIENNKAKFEQERPKVDNLQKIKSIFVNNITIDQVYEFIYSDKPFTLRGKPEDSFFAYVMKKVKNFNYSTIPYDKPGPQFYSRDPNVKFTNAPFFSFRKNEFDHPMPPIPFMPKHCHCSQSCKIYWISHQYFDYEVVSLSSGAPYADTFEVKIVHRISKQGTGVKIEMMGNLFFIKQTSMKGMLQSKGTNEMREGGTATINQIQKILNSISGNTQEEPEQQQQQTTKGDSSKVTPKNELDKLKDQKKMLIIALFVVIALNVILKFFIS